MNLRFDGKVALVTGASTGIGRAAAMELGASGAAVGVNYLRSEQKAREVVEHIERSGGRALLLQADVSNPAQVKAMIAQVCEKFGGLDILINNAGSLVQRCPVEQMSDDLFDRIMDVNLRSAFLCSREAIPVMREKGYGRIVNISSIAARNGGGPGAVLYAASKGAVATLTRGLARELAPFGITVNAVAPGVILTPFHERFSTPEQLENFRRSAPLARLGKAEDCVGAIVFLASDAAAYITGAMIDVNGGMWMG